MRSSRKQFPWPEIALLLCAVTAVLSALLLGGCSATAVRRTVTGDYGWCADNGDCGQDAERWQRFLECMQVASDALASPTVHREAPAETGWWLGRCSWLRCTAHPSGLCKGRYTRSDRTVHLPAGDDKSLEHEFCHYVLHVTTGDSDRTHKGTCFRSCGLPKLCCRD